MYARLAFNITFLTFFFPNVSKAYIAYTLIIFCWNTMISVFTFSAIIFFSFTRLTRNITNFNVINFLLLNLHIQVLHYQNIPLCKHIDLKNSFLANIEVHMIDIILMDHYKYYKCSDNENINLQLTKRNYLFDCKNSLNKYTNMLKFRVFYDPHYDNQCIYPLYQCM